VVEGKELQDSLYKDGFSVSGNIGEKRIASLKALYHQLHDFKESNGGMFYSLYSNDINYRKKVHFEIEAILKDVYDSLFVDYKTVINSFIVKLPGPKSDFTLHQDSTGLDEYKDSPLSVWIPLQDTDISNGTLCVIPKTHGFFHPYRGISFASPFSNYEDLLRKYLIPINLKAGDVLLFDNRLVHYSHLNFSDVPRIVAMSGIFPKDAEIVSVYKDESIMGSPLEIYKQEEDFLLTNTAFYENCTARPYLGKKVLEVKESLEEKTVYDFLNWTDKEGVEPTNISQLVEVAFNMNIISEPV
jgi:hypothetical protein